jgi:hypothetical protein
VGGIFAARRRKYMACPRCMVRNLRAMTVCPACGAALHAGTETPPGGPQPPPGGPAGPPGADHYPPQGGWPPQDPNATPPPPSDWPPAPQTPGGPGFGGDYPQPQPQPQQSGQPPPWSTEEALPPGRNRPPDQGWGG